MTPETVEILSWVDLEARLSAIKFTGPIMVQWAQGKPQEVQIPGPVTRIKLDKRGRSSQT